MHCAAEILEAVSKNVPELIYAEGLELDICKLRHSDPEKLFELAGQMGAQLSAQYESGNDE